MATEAESGATQVSGTNMKFDPRDAWSRLGTPGKVATAALGVALVVLISIVPAFVRALWAPSAETQSSAEGDKELAAKTKEKFPGYLAQIEGRSLFLTPGPTKQESPKPEDEPIEDDQPQKPATYGGPAVIAMMGDSVWFDNGKRMQVGDERDGDIRVVAVNIPWEATIEWQAVEFKVGLLKKDDLVIKEQAKEAPKDEPAADVAPGDGVDEEAAVKPSPDVVQGTPKVTANGEKPVEPVKEEPKPDAAPVAPVAEPAKPGSS
jgi:hypothetical protein